MLACARAAMFAAVISLFAGPSIAQERTKITIGSVNAADYMAAYVAIEEGYFAKRGLDVTLQSLPGGSVLPAMQSGSTQIAGIPVTNLLLAVEGGLDLRIIAAADVTRPSDKIWGLVVGGDGSVKEPKDLRGKKVAVPSVGGFMYLMVANWLDKGGVKLKDVGMVEMPFDQVGDLVKSGSIQAGTVTEPIMTRAAEISGGKILHYFAADYPENTVVSVYATTGKWATDHPKAIEAFRAGLVEGAAFMKDHADKTKTYLSAYTKLPPNVAANTILPTFIVDISLPQIAFLRDAMLKLNLLKTKVDVTKMQGWP